MALEGAFFFLLIGFYDYFGLGFTTLLILKVAFVRVIHYHLKKKQRAQVLCCVPLSDHRLLGLNFSQKIKLGSYAFLNFSFSYFFFLSSSFLKEEIIYLRRDNAIYLLSIMKLPSIVTFSPFLHYYRRLSTQIYPCSP